MPQDLLEIALEHHRCGRLRQAEAGYRALLEIDPSNADALHWLGVLLSQAGRPDQAVPLLEQAAAARPSDAAFRHNLAEAYLACGRSADAAAAFELAAALAPDRAETLRGLGLARLARRSPGDAAAAATAFRRAHSAGLDTPELHLHLATALLADGKPDEAIAACRAALAKKPDDPLAYYHLALCHRRKGENREARRFLNKALELEPTLARAWHALAALDAEAGNLEIAAALFRKAIKFKPDYAAAHEGLGRVLQQLGRRDEAAAAFHKARAGSAVGSASADASASASSPATPASTAVADLERRLAPAGGTTQLHQALSMLTNVFPPQQAPADAVADLFDRYAGGFDEHLRGKLQYRGPELIADAVRAALGPAGSGRKLDVLDLGCGTGLCGPLLRPLAATLAGIDLSPAMIDQARSRGVYDRLDVGDLVATLRNAPRSFDLLVAADVFVYVGDLAPALEAAAAALRPGGLLAFTVEAGPGDRYLMDRQTLRFTHSKAYLQRLSSIYGFEERTLADVVTRIDMERPVAGYLVVLQLPAREQGQEVQG